MKYQTINAGDHFGRLETLRKYLPDLSRFMGAITWAIIGICYMIYSEF